MLRKKGEKFFIILFILTFLLRIASFAQLLAFPEAEGFGRFTAGGRGGKVLIVNNLTDSVKNPLAGSLRWAINQKGARIIIFATSGNIALNGPLKIKNGNLTIAGQSAPGDGICIRNYAVSLSADNIIIRFLRFRCGNEKISTNDQDAMNGTKLKNIIIDHCSMSWSIDEVASFYDNENFTMQWCIVSESLYNAGHPKGAHGYGGIWGGMGASFHHNLLANNVSRNPRFCGARYHKNVNKHELVDLRNNVIYNWGMNSIYGGEDGWHNVVANYFKAGPATKEHRDRILNPDGVTSKFYIAENFIENYPLISADNWNGGVQDADTAMSVLKADTPFEVAPIKTHIAQQAYIVVLKYAGAYLPTRDKIDNRIINDTRTGTSELGDSYGKSTGIIDSQKSVGNWPELKKYKSKKDSDSDGMPDKWEKKQKLNSKNPEDGILDKNGNGYTNLEEYLNGLVKIEGGIF